MRPHDTYRQNGAASRTLPSMHVSVFLELEARYAGIGSKRAPGFKDHRWLRSVAAAKERRAAR